MHPRQYHRLACSFWKIVVPDFGAGRGNFASAQRAQIEHRAIYVDHTHRRANDDAIVMGHQATQAARVSRPKKCGIDWALRCKRAAKRGDDYQYSGRRETYYRPPYRRPNNKVLAPTLREP